MRTFVLPFLGVGFILTVVEGDLPSVRITCSDHEHGVDPPLFVQTVLNEVHFRCASGFELVGQRISTCVSTGWDHELPSCRELPKTTLKMKCPYDHRTWSLENLDNIASWISNNEDNVLILDRKFTDGTIQSQRLASAMLERMNDPFYRFFGKMATYDKAILDREGVVRRFKDSAEFRRLAKKMRENDPNFDQEMPLDADEDDEVLKRYYGLHYLDVLSDRILPYAESVSALATVRPFLSEVEKEVTADTAPSALNVEETSHPESNISETNDEAAFYEMVANDVIQDILIQQKKEEIEPQVKESAQSSYESQTDLDKSDDLIEPDDLDKSKDSAEKVDIGGPEEEHKEEEPSSRKKKRERGESELLLPTRSRFKDYFDRDLTQVLDGTKAELQEVNLRNSYFSHLVTVIKHIIKFNIPKRDWPEFLQRFEYQQLTAFLERNGDRIDTPPAFLSCPKPWDIGFEMIRHGRPVLDRTGQRITIECDAGYILRGPADIYCEGGKWITRKNRMPICEDARGPTPVFDCEDPSPNFIRNGRLIQRPGLPTGRILIKCNPGYTLKGDSQMLCDRGRWIPIAGRMPTCENDPKLVDPCMDNPPNAPVHGAVTEPHRLTNQDRTVVVRFMCNEGFGLHGIDYSKCESGTWSPLAPVCVADGKNEIPHNDQMPQAPSRCPSLRIPGGRVHYYEEAMPNYARLTCAPGYRLNGHMKIICTEGGAWSQPLPSCISSENDLEHLTTCKPIHAPPNVEVDYITATAVRFRCRPGYRIVGKYQTTCYRGRWLDEAPRCLADVIGGCNIEEPVLGQNMVVFAYSDGRWFSCDDGFEMVGNLSVQLCRDGRWDAEPVCVASPGSLPHDSKPSRIFPTPHCPLPPRADGVIMIPRNDKVYYRCQPGEQLVGRDFTECVGGRWLNPQAPQCFRITPQTSMIPPTQRSTYAPFRRCTPQHIRGGDAYLYSQGRVIYYQCYADYIIRGASMLQCENSRWSQPEPLCAPPDGLKWPSMNGEIIYESENCTAPTTVANSHMTVRDRGRRITYTCQHHLHSETERVCPAHTNMWTGPLPDCSLKGVCEPQEIENGRFYQYSDDVGYIQCNHGFVIENASNEQRNQQTYCRQDIGVWDFGVRPPRCVPDQRVDTRPDPTFIESQLGDPSNTRFQIDECPPPQVSSKYTWYIQGPGKVITLGCKSRTSKRSVGALICEGDKWLHNVGASACNGQDVPAACSMGGRVIENGGFFVYDENHYVFQCNIGFNLEGSSMAVCPGYRPTYPKAIFVLNDDFVLPRCVPTSTDSRRDLWESTVDGLDPHFEGRQCHWPKQLANAKSTEYFIMEGGRRVAFRCSGSKNSVRCENGQWRGDDLSCLERQYQQIGCDDRLPNEPLQGTYFQYQDGQSTTRMFYFQCNTGYILRGQAILPCSDSTTPRGREPDCVLDPDPFSSALVKVKNPQPFTVIQCGVPPHRIEGGHIVVQDSGERVLIHCRPGYVIEGHPVSSMAVSCSRLNERWSANWPKCVQRGEWMSMARYDPFGRPLPQALTGEKAANQNQRLREQFLGHVQQMRDYRLRNLQTLNSQGMQAGPLPPLRLPVLPGLPSEITETLGRDYPGLYEQAQLTLDRTSRRRDRRKIHNDELDAADPPIKIPESLKQFEKDIVENRLSQQDVDTLEWLPDTKLRLKFIEDRRIGNHKSKDDPIQSQKFLSQVLSTKPNSTLLTDSLAEDVETLPLTLPFKAVASAPRPIKFTATEDGHKPVNKTQEAESSASFTGYSNEFTPSTAETDLVKSTTPTSKEVSDKNIAAEISDPMKWTMDLMGGENAINVIEQYLDARNNDLGNKSENTSNGTIATDGVVEDNMDNELTIRPVKEMKESKIKSDKKAKKGYDTSCALLDNKAPDIENGFILSYELINGTDSQMLRVTYRCDPEYRFRYDHTSSLLCRLGQWRGDVPECIPDEDDNDGQEED